jgi:signal transduction histidine kinase
MKLRFSRNYQAALQACLTPGPGARALSPQGLGQQALAAGLQTTDIAKLHELILVTQVLPGRPASQRAALIKRAGAFFIEAITPIEKIHLSAKEATVHLNQIVEMLSQRTVELAASNLALEQEFKKSEQHYSQLLEKSHGLQEQLRQLSRQILLAQEDERKKISRELHDVIAQTLTGINVRLASLKKEALLNTTTLAHNIDRTQRLVEKSVEIVHQFARELRPAALDDLGLIPALHSFMKHFTERTGVRTHLKAYAAVEQVDTAKRTVLFRVAQESLTNVARHAQATRADVTIEKQKDGICMTIKDNGKSFRVEHLSLAKGRKHLGLLGMRERLEMVGGKFGIESAPGKGTVITAQLPADLRREAGAKPKSTAPVGATR